MATKFQLQGSLDLENPEILEEVGSLKALVLDRHGQTVGAGKIDASGEFSIPVKLRAPVDVRLVVGPDGSDEELRKSRSFVQELPASLWKSTRGGFRLKTGVIIDRELVISWLPKRICVSGHVRKLDSTGETATACPVPFVKVEVFDVDREGCWWDHIRVRLPELLDRRVIRIPDLIDPRPLPDPFPIPVPVGPRPLPKPIPLPDPGPFRPRKLGRLQPVQPFADHFAEPLFEGTEAENAELLFEEGLVGEVQRLDPEVQKRLSALTLTTHLAPWMLLPNCFYSRKLVCTTTTDEEGFFNCCFNWWPFHIRRGRLRFDRRPDIIIRVTQVVDGVEQVLYMDPYTSTRWNVCNTHIDLYLDDERVVCGDPDPQERPPQAQAFFTRIGHNDEVYKINQANGLYEHLGVTNAAYGKLLRIFGQFGDNLSQGAHYYRLSYAKKSGGSFTNLNSTLNDTRVHRVTNFSESHKLGPHTVNGQPALYEVRNFDDYLWYHADLIGLWNTNFENDEDTYVLRLEVFDNAGAKLGAAQVDYLDGTVAPSAVLPPTGTDWADLVIHIDNKAPVVALTVPSVTDPVCGIIPWTPALSVNLDVSVVQENGRLHDWGLSWVKGVTGGSGSIQGGTPPASANGSPANIHVVLPAVDNATATSLVAGLTKTCAFSFHLWAYAHVRNGDGWLVYGLRGSDTIAVAVEKCS